MKTFISYRFSGEDPSELDSLMKKVCSALDRAGHKNYCSLWDSKNFAEKKFSGKQIMEYAFNEINKADVFLALVKSEHMSDGMLVEAGYALAKNKKVLLFINKTVKDHILRRLFEGHVHEFDDFEDLENKLSNLKI